MCRLHITLGKWVADALDLDAWDNDINPLIRDWYAVPGIEDYWYDTLKTLVFSHDLGVGPLKVLMGRRTILTQGTLSEVSTADVFNLVVHDLSERIKHVCGCTSAFDVSPEIHLSIDFAERRQMHVPRHPAECPTCIQYGCPCHTVDT